MHLESCCCGCGYGEQQSPALHSCESHAIGRAPLKSRQTRHNAACISTVGYCESAKVCLIARLPLYAQLHAVRLLASVLQAASLGQRRLLVYRGGLTDRERPRIAGIFENGPSSRRVSESPVFFSAFVTEEKPQNARRARGKRVENA